ncbi:unnamed protein product [Ilex paraguariensis]|uniref:WRKY domain-containing protein n=1 Tax=Ilex paraguariensis TaxID=185542 RepID=A0ABC8QQE5_9AQUA
MEEGAISLVFHGFKLARELEENLPNITNQPAILSAACDEIIKVFTNARDRFNAQSTQQEIAVGMQEWLKQGCTQAMDLLQSQLMGGSGKTDQFGGGGMEMVGGRDRETSAWLGGGGGAVQLMDVADSGRGGSSSSQRPRRRKDEANRRIERLPAPRMGNTEIPPEDGYTWRKYGQKEILGSRFPRSYYRCTHQKLYQCPAKKQVQRLDDDPYTFEVMYRGDHTCIMSSTAPSAPPTSVGGATTTHEVRHSHHYAHMQMQPPPPPPTPSASVPLSRWLSMDMQMYRHFGLSGPGGASSSSGGSGMVASGGAGPSTGRYRREVDYPVVDLADAMFNSGSSSNNSMEVIFSSMEEKKEGGGEDPKN